MFALALILVVAAAIHVAVSSELAAAVLLLYATHALWRHHRSASAKEAEQARLEAEEEAFRREDNRMVEMLQRAKDRRQAESGASGPRKRRSSARLKAIDPAEAAKALGKMIAESDE